MRIVMLSVDLIELAFRYEVYLGSHNRYTEKRFSGVLVTCTVLNKATKISF